MDAFPRTVVEFRENDVLFGKGSTIASSEGNLRFRYVVQHFREEYISATMGEKRAIAQQVIDLIARLKPPGRFVERDPHEKESVYLVVDPRRALEKTCQALRHKKYDSTRLKEESRIQVDQLIEDAPYPNRMVADASQPWQGPRMTKRQQARAKKKSMETEEKREAVRASAAKLPRPSRSNRGVSNLSIKDRKHAVKKKRALKCKKARRTGLTTVIDFKCDLAANKSECSADLLHRTRRKPAPVLSPKAGTDSAVGPVKTQLLSALSYLFSNFGVPTPAVEVPTVDEALQALELTTLSHQSCFEFPQLGFLSQSTNALFHPSDLDGADGPLLQPSLTTILSGIYDTTRSVAEQPLGIAATSVPPNKFAEGDSALEEPSFKRCFSLLDEDEEADAIYRSFSSL